MLYIWWCRRLLWHAGDYIFYDLFGEFQPSLDAWLDILRQVEGATHYEKSSFCQPPVFSPRFTGAEGG